MFSLFFNVQSQNFLRKDLHPNFQEMQISGIFFIEGDLLTLTRDGTQLTDELVVINEQ